MTTTAAADATRIHALLAAHARQAPAAPALEALDRGPLSYGTLWERVQYTCGVLRGRAQASRVGKIA